MRIRVAGAPIVQAIITLWILAILAGGVQAQTTQIWTVPEVGALPYDANGLLVAAARRRSKARPHGLRAPLRRLPQHRWVGRAPQHSLFRPRIHDPAAMGPGQLQ